MICDFGLRNGNYAGASLWHGEAIKCPEYFATWREPGDIPISAGDTASDGNHGSLPHGLSSLAVALAILLWIADATPARASRHCLDRAEASRTWPTRLLEKDGDGCWTYDHHPRRAGVSVALQETPAPVQMTTLPNRWDDRDSDEDTVQLELASFEPEHASEPPPPEPLAGVSQFALFISLVLAVAAVVEVTTGRHAARSRWPDRKTLAALKRR
jgi:hypothetical protein